jgi:hypothetical protein
MTNSAQKRTNIVGFFAIVALSAITMVWLFWHYPLSTGVATLAVLAAFGISARLARAVDTDSLSDLTQGEQSA